MIESDTEIAVNKKGRRVSQKHRTNRQRLKKKAKALKAGKKSIRA